MRTIVAGTRSFEDEETVYEVLDRICGWDIECLLHGDDTGVDTIAGQWADKQESPVRPFRRIGRAMARQRIQSAMQPW